MNDEMMVPCDHVIAKLWEYVDGDLDELRSDQVRRHLEACARCFPEYNFRRAYLEFMRRCSTQEVPQGLRRQIFAALLEEEGKHGSGGALSRSPSLFGRAQQALLRFIGRE